MPLARYQLKNELRLGDPELHRAADKDDPETLLEAVAMAGLAGLLRQLGDLSQFAAEIFHDLHEEVMVTTARGQGLMARVQQLEAEVPSLEKAFLSQTHHLSFFSKGGIGWHPNLQSEHNLISRGDMPRFVMDSYEECRGPPQLFLLDKFDVAGAGACLKRYTDPSFFKLESASSGLATVEVYREKKNHKIKKKGTRIRNGETPEVASTHTKLHQLLLEERIENACADPGRLVKLKNRQLNGFATEAKTGRSYMEKFLESPLQDDEVARETSISPPHVRLVSDDTSEEGIKILEISTVGPVKRSLENERTYSWTNEEEAMPKPSLKMRRETDGNLVKKHEQGSSRVSDEISINYSKVPESELEMDKQKERENYLYGYHSDDLTSEVDHHLDALATGEPELDIDYKYRDKNSFLHIQKLKDSDDKEHQQQDRFLHSQSFTNSLMSDGISSFKRDINEVHAELQARLSDSQSGTSFTSDDNSSLKRDRNEEYSKWKAQFSDFQYTGKSSTSDVNSSFDKDIPCFSCSDSLSTVGETIPSEPVSFKSNEYNGSEIEHTSSSQLTQIVETQKTDRGKFLMHDGTHDQEKVISGTGDVSSGSYLMNSGRKLLYSDFTATSMTKISKRAQSKETQTGLIEHQLRLADEGTKHHAGSMDAIPGAFPQMKVDADATVSSEKYRLNELADGDQSVSCNAILKISNDLKLASGDECSESSKIKRLQAESPNQNCSDILVCRETGTEEHPICSSTEVDLLSSSTALMLDVQPSKAADGTEATQLNSQDESESWGVKAKCYDQQSQFEDLSEMEHCDELSGSTCRVDADEDDSLLKGSSLGDYGGQDYHVTDDVASTELQPEDQSVSVDAAENDLNIASCLASSMISSTSRNLSNLQEPMPGTCSHETKMESNEAEPIKIAVDLNAEKMENQQEPSSDSNVISSSMRSSTNFEESRFSFADPQEKQRDISEAVDRQSLTKLEKQRGVHQLNAAYANIELSLNRSMPCDNSEICNSIQGSSPKEQTEHSSVKDKILKFSKLDSREPKTKSLLQSKRLRNGKDGLASSSSNQLESGNHLEKFLLLQDGQGDAGFLPRCLENSSSKKPQSEQMQISNHLEKERNSYAASRSVPEIHPGQSSSFESLSLSASPEVNFTKHVMDKPHPPLPDPLSEAPKINSGEMPPMPPLPPMQWRTGKVQPASLASVSFQSLQPIKSKEQAQYSSPTSEREALQFQNPVLPVMAMEGDKLQNTSGFLVGGHPVAISMELPIMLNEANGKYNYLVLERSQTHNPFQTLPVPVVPASKPAQGYIVASEREVVQNSNTSSPIAPVEHDISVQDPISPEELSQPPSQPILEVKTLQQPANNLEGKQGDPSILPMSPSGMENVQPNHNLLPSEGKQEDPSNSPMSPPGMENVQPNHNLLRSESEMASTLDKSDLASDFERERLNGKPNDKLPRPRSPAIDAVAALDKSKLRKVADRPPTVPKVEERDSFLEQIRTKSFNLRPTATTRKRYHYQGPRTNLKVAAILEKANAIRQALAGSDEDDDKDSWSDS